MKSLLYLPLIWAALIPSGWGFVTPEIDSAPPFSGHYHATGYQESYRPQFHFSPRNGWMNDINALWYVDGIYHMTYQWGTNKRDGGYTSSTDLLHLSLIHISEPTRPY